MIAQHRREAAFGATTPRETIILNREMLNEAQAGLSTARISVGLVLIVTSLVALWRAARPEAPTLYAPSVIEMK